MALSSKFWFIIALVFIGGSAALARIRQVAETSHSPGGNSIGQGGSQVVMPFDSTLYQAASMTEFERLGIGLGYGQSENFKGYWLGMFYPGSIGVIGLQVSHLQNASVTGDLNSFTAINFGYARRITRRFSLGFYLRPSFGEAAAGQLFGFGLEPSARYDTFSSIKLGNNFGIFDLKIYALAKNLSYYFGDAKNLAPRSSLHLGIAGDFHRYGAFSLGLSSELFTLNPFNSAAYSGGLSLKHRYFNISGGYLFSSDQASLAGPSMGAGLQLPFDNGLVALRYAYLPRVLERKEEYHFFGAYGTYGFIDTEPPEVELSLDNLAFSPNDDGIKDYINFSIYVRDASPIASWKLEIYNQLGQRVRVFAHDNRSLEKKIDITKSVGDFFRNKESLVVPQKIRWDGTADAIAIEDVLKKGANTRARLIDGIYTYQFSAEDIRGNKSRPVVGNVQLDTVAPSVRLSLENQLFSPNNDGQIDLLLILHETRAEPGDRFTAFFKNSQGQIVRSYAYKGNEVVDNLVWAGFDDQKQPAPEGIYTYEIYGNDNAGNSTRVVTQQISLIRAIESLALKLDHEGFSPNGDGLLEALAITPVVSSLKGLQSWQVVVVDEIPEKDEELPTGIFSWSGKTGVPEKLNWRGLDRYKQRLNDGKYFLLMQNQYASGNRPRSPVRQVVIDTRPPRLAVEADIDMFSPDGDGENEEQKFYLDIEDMSDIKEYELRVYEINYNEQGEKMSRLFRRFSGGSKHPEKIYWDGKGDAGNLVEGATMYEYQLEASDIYRNRTKTNIRRFETDIMVLNSPKGLRIRLSNTGFARDKAALNNRLQVLLDRLAGFLLRYKGYRFRIEGHTDDRGSEEFNLRLSEQRAKACMDYLVKQGLKPEKLSYQGLGETETMVPNSSEYNRGKNRRIEIFLLKE